ncbi:hypothetical protein ABFS82_08G170500 [Erythranthe guttata]
MTGHTLPYDEYLWIQYGKRVVGGNDFPVRYYRCSYPGCTVRKKCVRSPTGEITEIVYRDSHHHPKPHLIDIDLSFATRDGGKSIRRLQIRYYDLRWQAQPWYPSCRESRNIIFSGP